jgi:cell division septation protein DedD
LATSQATAEPAYPEGASASPAAPAGTASQSAAADPAAGSASPPAAGGQEASEGAPGGQSAAQSVPIVTTLKAQEPSGAALETPASPPKSPVSGSRNAPNDPAAGPQGRRGWSVQLGSFASRANAERLVHQLQARGGSSLYVSASGSGPSLRYRVRVGPLADRGAAERAAGKLRAAGHPATIVTPSS